MDLGPDKEARTCPICGEVFKTSEAMQNCIAQHEEDVLWFDLHHCQDKNVTDISQKISAIGS